MIITIGNNKGGVLKTTLATNIATQLFLNGKKVCLLDMDGQANVALTFKSRSEVEKINYTIWQYLTSDKLKIKEITDFYINEKINHMQTTSKGSLACIYSKKDLYQVTNLTSASKEKFINKLAALLTELEKQFDYVVIDTSPSFDFLNKFIYLNADLFIVPFEPSKYSLTGLQEIVKEVIEKNKKLKMLFAPVKINKRSNFHNENIALLDDYLKALNLNAFVTENFISLSSTKPVSVLVMENVPLVLAKSKAKTTEKLKEEYRNLTNEIMKKFK